MSDERQDVVVCFYACPTQLPKDDTGEGASWRVDLCGKVANRLWSGERAAQKPLILQCPGKGAAGNDFVSFPREMIQNYGSFIKGFIGPKLGGKQLGRLALVGFSAGCGGVKTVLANAEDRRQVDFVCACDGAHGDYGNTGFKSTSEERDEEAHINAISYADIAPWVEFAVEAAQPEANGIPKRCMVITNSRVLPTPVTVASTRVTAARILREVQQRVSSIASPCIVPGGLVGYSRTGATEPVSAEGCFPSWWNICKNVEGKGGCNVWMCPPGLEKRGEPKPVACRRLYHFRQPHCCRV